MDTSYAVGGVGLHHGDRTLQRSSETSVESAATLALGGQAAGAPRPTVALGSRRHARMCDHATLRVRRNAWH